MAYSISLIKGMMSFKPSPRMVETASERLQRLLTLSEFGTPVSDAVLCAAVHAAREESRVVRITL